MNSISNKTRKLLWGRSGNRCVICKCELIMDANNTDDESVVGDECHIISREQNGPRHDPSFPTSKMNSYENLILLCRTHHKMIDDQVITYSTDVLKLMKANHERWVSETLNPQNNQNKPIRLKRFKKNIPEHLVRIINGKDLLNIIDGTHASYQDHPDLKNEEEKLMNTRKTIKNGHENYVVSQFITWYNKRYRSNYTIVDKPNPPDAIARSNRRTL